MSGEEQNIHDSWHAATWIRYRAGPDTPPDIFGVSDVFATRDKERFLGGKSAGLHPCTMGRNCMKSTHSTHKHKPLSHELESE